MEKTGHCRCSAVRFSVRMPPILTMACHCTGCQRMTASAFSLSAAIPLDGFAIVQGDTMIGGLHGASAHHFCGHCKSWLFTRADAMPFINIRPTMLEDAAWSAPFIETFTSEKLPWATTSARHSFAQFPPMETFGGLIADYRRCSRQAET